MKIPHFQDASAGNVLHGCKVNLVNAKIHVVDGNVHLVMTVCIFLVMVYVLTELMGAMAIDLETVVLKVNYW